MIKKIAILDYGLGNIRSVSNAVIFNDAIPLITKSENEILHADGLIVPGVGAFPHAIETLKKTGLCDVVIDYAKSGKSILGICLGMQILFDKGYEFKDTSGLGIIPGEVKRIHTSTVNTRLPHIKWSLLKFNNSNSAEMFEKIEESEARFYFVHSFAANHVPNKYLAATTFYDGTEIVAAVKKGNVWGTQFHPEKSGKQGLQLIKNFINNCE
jgi:imidazole glycerol-phosphate synthase subunit HisH